MYLPMTTTSFLFELCDFNHDYAGCSTLPQLLIVNEIQMFLWGFCAVLNCVYPIERIYSFLRHKKPLDKLWNITMTLSLWNFAMTVSKTASFVITRQVILPNQTNDSLEEMVRLHILVDMVFGICAWMGGFSYSEWIVKYFSGVQYRTLSSIRTSKIVHGAIIVGMFVIISCYLTIGLKSLQDFIVWRRVVFACGSAVNGVVEPLLLYKMGAQSIQVLLNQDKAAETPDESKIKSIKRKILRIKSAIWNMNVSHVIFGLHSLLSVVLNEVYTQDHWSILWSAIVLGLVNVIAMYLPVLSIVVPTILKLIGRPKARSSVRQSHNGSSQKNNESDQKVEPPIATVLASAPKSSFLKTIILRPSSQGSK
ncbi:hypothetical protein HDV03_005522 [Kappamyces sp. JEL0829]|nr:hypothetical protein HDV03_005522 [Kappamyces sp. JEL0829]